MREIVERERERAETDMRELDIPLFLLLETTSLVSKIYCLRDHTPFAPISKASLDLSQTTSAKVHKC